MPDRLDAILHCLDERGFSEGDVRSECFDEQDELTGRFLLLQHCVLDNRLWISTHDSLDDVEGDLLAERSDGWDVVAVVDLDTNTEFRMHISFTPIQPPEGLR